MIVTNQVTPMPLTLDGRRRTTRLPLETLAAHLRRGSSYELQLIRGTLVYDFQRSAGAVNFSRIAVKLPVALGGRG